MMVDIICARGQALSNAGSVNLEDIQDETSDEDVESISSGSEIEVISISTDSDSELELLVSDAPT
eukprot:6229725-Karenia_brevis.AAC.1